MRCGTGTLAILPRHSPIPATPTHYSLLSLFTIHYSLLTTHYSLLTTHCSLHTCHARQIFARALPSPPCRTLCRCVVSVRVKCVQVRSRCRCEAGAAAIPVRPPHPRPTTLGLCTIPFNRPRLPRSRSRLAQPFGEHGDSRTDPHSFLSQLFAHSSFLKSPAPSVCPWPGCVRLT